MNIEEFKYLCLTEIKMLFVVRNRRSSAYDILCGMHKISQFLNDLMTFMGSPVKPCVYPKIIDSL